MATVSPLPSPFPPLAFIHAFLSRVGSDPAAGKVGWRSPLRVKGGHATTTLHIPLG